MKSAPWLILLAAGLLLSTEAAAEEQSNSLWNDGEPEVILGAFFDEAGSDTVIEGQIPDTLTVLLIMQNGGSRDEGPVLGIEYSIELPAGLSLVREELPAHTNMAMGTVLEGLTQAIREQPGNGLIVNTLTLAHSGPVPYDARIRVLPHPVSHGLRYVHRWGKTIADVDTHSMLGQDAILNPKLTGAAFQPVKGSN